MLARPWKRHGRSGSDGSHSEAADSVTNVQVQRVLGPQRAVPVFDVQQEKGAGSRHGVFDGLSYDGDGERVVRFSGSSIVFYPRSTPAMAAAAAAAGREKVRRLSGVEPAADAKGALGQPVVWQLSSAANGSYSLQEASTGVELGRWARVSPATDDSTDPQDPDAWVFESSVDRQTALLRGNLLTVSAPADERFTYLDALTAALRRKHARDLVAVHAGPGLRERDVAEAASPRFIKSAAGETIDRMRVADALIFAALALRLAVYGRRDSDAAESATAETLDGRRPSLGRRLSLEHPRRLFSAVFSSVKSMFVRA